MTQALVLFCLICVFGEASVQVIVNHSASFVLRNTLCDKPGIKMIDYCFTHCIFL